jgi:hypothetical protein
MLKIFALGLLPYLSRPANCVDLLVAVTGVLQYAAERAPFLSWLRCGSNYAVGRIALVRLL